MLREPHHWIYRGARLVQSDLDYELAHSATASNERGMSIFGVEDHEVPWDEIHVAGWGIFEEDDILLLVVRGLRLLASSTGKPTDTLSSLE